MSKKKIFKDILTWAEERKILTDSNPTAQMLKMTEEVGELAGAIARGNMVKANDAIGDSVVVLTIVAAQLGLSIEDCIASAYGEIKDRKGEMVNGIFIKGNLLTI